MSEKTPAPKEPRAFGLSRRGFLSLAALGGGACALLAGGFGLSRRRALGTAAAGTASRPALATEPPRARFWVSTQQQPKACTACHADGGSEAKAGEHDHDEVLVRCQLCARECIIAEGERGTCNARANVGGELKSLVYGRPAAIHTDPIEKKPFYHFLPGTTAYSLGTTGCPLHCQFCQNWQLSQARPEEYQVGFVAPEAVVATASARSPTVAFTYNEASVFFEYLTDIAQAAKKRGLRRVLVSCGYMNEAPLREICELLDAVKIDLKGFSESFYREVSKAELKPVLRSIKQIARSGRHLEIVNLVVPTLNDSDAMLSGLVDWVASELGPDVPVHFTRFHPDYRLENLPPTPVSTLTRAREMALLKGLHYAYVGNVPGHPGNNTYCPKCGKVLIERQGFFVARNHLKAGRCGFCSQPIAGVWS